MKIIDTAHKLEEKCKSEQGNKNRCNTENNKILSGHNSLIYNYIFLKQLIPTFNLRTMNVTNIKFTLNIL